MLQDLHLANFGYKTVFLKYFILIVVIILIKIVILNYLERHNSDNLTNRKERSDVIRSKSVTFRS